MNRILYILVFFMMAALTDASAQVDKREVRRGNRDFKKENYKEAELEYFRALAKDTLSFTANYNMANTLYRQGSFEQAKKHLDKIKDVAAASPAAADYYYNLGNVAVALQDYQTAVDAYKQSLLRNPADLEAKENYIYAKEKLTAEQEGLRINPNSIFLRLTWMYDPAPLEISRHRDFFSNTLPKLHTEEVLSFAVHDKRGITDVNSVIRNLEKAMDLPGGAYDFGCTNSKCMYQTAVDLFAGLGLDTDRIRADETAFRENPRDMTLNLEAVNRYGITFADTTEELIRNFSKYL